MAIVGSTVILAGGLGTRMLPASKAVPKELLPLADRPIIQYAVEESAASGVSHVVIVTSEGKDAIRQHFGEPHWVTESLERQGRDDLAGISASPARIATVEFATQHEPKGIAHALKQAQELVRGDAMIVVYPDDVIFGEPPVMAQLIEAYKRRPGTVLAVQEVPESEVSNYGLIAPSGDGDPIPVRRVVEKPAREDAPSRLAIVGRLVVPSSIFGYIDRLKPGKGGELQLTDAIGLQLEAGEPVSAVQFRGERFDTGRPPGYVAANVAAALRRDEYREQTIELVTTALERS
jgi:UTP--glucose-1-phosphate uridylyltransferase